MADWIDKGVPSRLTQRASVFLHQLYADGLPKEYILRIHFRAIDIAQERKAIRIGLNHFIAAMSGE